MNIITQYHENFVVPSDVIADQTDSTHHAILQLVDKYIADFDSFGRVAFENKTFDTAGGQQSRRVAMLNENQATLLLTYMRNNDIVRAFKVRLVTAFSGLHNKTPTIPQTYAEALQLAADQAKQLELAAPKVSFVDTYVDRGTLENAISVAQAHGMSAVKMNRILDEIGGVYNKAVKRGRVFCQSWVDKGFGITKETESGHSQALFTTSGAVGLLRC